MTIREQKFALCRVAFAVTLAVVVAVNALAGEEEISGSELSKPQLATAADVTGTFL